MINRLICGLLILVCSFLVNADCFTSEKKTIFVFSNGMLNGEIGIKESTLAMERLVRDLIFYHDKNGTPIFDKDETYDLFILRSTTMC